MLNEQQKTLDVIKTAIQMEIDGKAFYLKAAGSSGNDLGKKLFTSLAAEEDGHRQLFETIYNSISARQKWPETGLHKDQTQGIRTLLAQATEQMGTGVKAAQTELDAVQTAMSLEDKTFDYYRVNGDKATYPAEKDLYRKLAAQEADHKLILADYYEYLVNPAAYFVQKEHHSLDGG
ncbi:MAG: ferritin family protein [Dehalococcoidales bacterium]|jgi:rubrerythrin